MNFIYSLIGAAILIALGFVIGFWLDVALTPSLPGGMKECTDCGPSFADTLRFWRGK